MFAVFYEKEEYYFLDGEKVFEQPEIYHDFQEAFERVRELQKKGCLDAHFVDYGMRSEAWDY